MGGTYPTEIIINVTDNQPALSWVDGGGSASSPLKSHPIFPNSELIRRRIQVRGMYLRTEHNASIDFLTRGSEEEIHSWASHHVMTRRSLWGTWPQFVSTNASTWEFPISGLNKLHYPIRDQEMFVRLESENLLSSRGV